MPDRNQQTTLRKGDSSQLRQPDSETAGTAAALLTDAADAAPETLGAALSAIQETSQAIYLAVQQAIDGSEFYKKIDPKNPIHSEWRLQALHGIFNAEQEIRPAVQRFLEGRGTELSSVINGTISSEADVGKLAEAAGLTFERAFSPNDAMVWHRHVTGVQPHPDYNAPLTVDQITKEFAARNLIYDIAERLGWDMPADQGKISWVAGAVRGPVTA